MHVSSNMEPDPLVDQIKLRGHPQIDLLFESIGSHLILFQHADRISQIAIEKIALSCRPHFVYSIAAQHWHSGLTKQKERRSEIVFASNGNSAIFQHRHRFVRTLGIFLCFRFEVVVHLHGKGEIFVNPMKI